MADRNYSLLLLGTLPAALLFATPVQAGGVLAGTLIENTAEARYTVGGITRTTPSNTVTITVDEILDVNVSTLDAGNVALTGNGAVLAFQLKNTGNGPESFILAADPALAGDDFNPAVTAIAYDDNGNGVYEAGVDPLISTGSLSPELAADGSLSVFVLVAFDSPLPADADLADVRLTATAATGSGTPGTVFAGQGTSGSDAVVGATTALDGDLGHLIAQLSGVTLVKSASVLDPFLGSQAIPGAIITYRLVASVAGSATIENLVIADPIPAGTTYVSGSLTLDANGLSDASDSDAGEADGSDVSVTIASSGSGSEHTVTFQVQIND
jgi:uncharacterized repeat protein (TIGR01451 family)